MKDTSKSRKSEYIDIKERYDGLLEENPDGILEVDVDGKIMYMNPACEQILGIPRVHCQKLNIREILLESDWDDENNIKVLVERVNTGEAKLRIQQDRYRYLRWKSIPIVENDMLVGGHLVLTDITNEKKANEELIYTKEQLQTIFDTIDVSMWSQDIPSKALIQVSPESERVWGVPLPELFSNPTAWYEAIHPDDVDGVREKMKEVDKGKQFIHDFRINHPNGDVRWIHERVTPVVEENGKVVRLVGLAMDITDTKEAEEERKRTLHLLERSERLTTVGQLAAGIAHEIRNPLTSIMGFIQLIQPQAPDYKEYLDIMQLELRRINSILGDFLVAAKPRPEQVKQENIGSIVQSTIDFLRGQTALTNIVIDMNLDPSIPPILCNASQLKQVVINLVKNSIEAMPHGGKIEIEAGIYNRDAVFVRITDNGDGIPPELISQIAEPFVTTKEDGTGLGMMVTQQIIHSHGGRMVVESEVGQGTSVSVLLPF